MAIRVRPLSALAFIVVFAALVLTLEWAAAGRWSGPEYLRVQPDDRGQVRLSVADLGKLQVRYYRFLNSGNQEVKFFVARDEAGVLQVAFDAGENHYRLRRGFTVKDGWVTDNKCDSTNRLSAVNTGGSGCMPTPLAHRLEGEELVLTESDILVGWRYFR